MVFTGVLELIIPVGRRHNIHILKYFCLYLQVHKLSQNKIYILWSPVEKKNVQRLVFQDDASSIKASIWHVGHASGSCLCSSITHKSGSERRKTRYETGAEETLHYRSSLRLLKLLTYKNITCENKGNCEHLRVRGLCSGSLILLEKEPLLGKSTVTGPSDWSMRRALCCGGAALASVCISPEVRSPWDIHLWLALLSTLWAPWNSLS